MGRSFAGAFADYQSDISRSGSIVEWGSEEESGKTILEALDKPNTLLWLKASGADLQWTLEVTPDDPRNSPSEWREQASDTLADGSDKIVFAGQVDGQAIRLDLDSSQSHEAMVIQSPRGVSRDAARRFFERATDGRQQSPGVTPQSLAATSPLSASGSETTFSDWSPDVAEGDSYVPTVTIDDETYLDVRHLSYLTIRVEATTSTDTTATVYERVSASDTDRTTSTTISGGDATETVQAASVEGVSYVRVTADQDATVYAGASA